jgi:membrane associated rhomboid family serine protease
MFPIGDDNRGAKGLPVVTLSLIAVNVLVFLYESTLNLDQLNRFIFQYGVIPAEIERGQDYYTLLTSMFVHGGLVHIAGNMLFLWIFGDNIEQRFGRVLYLLFYLGTGLAASYAHIQANAGAVVPSIGASGAISGVMGAYVLLYPLNRVRVFVWFWGITYLPAYIFLGVWFFMQLINGVAALSVPTAQSSGVAFWAHIGGFAAGVVGGAVLGALRPEPERARRHVGTPHDHEGWLW